MKKSTKLVTFNICIVIVGILCFSNRGFGLGFDTTNGAFKTALSVSIIILIIGFFFYGNYILLNQEKKVDNKIGLSTIDECINVLKKCKKTDPPFAEEIEITIEQLKSLQRKEDSLRNLLDINNANAYSCLNDTAQTANRFVLANVKSLVNRLIAFDSESFEYERLEAQKIAIKEIIAENNSILREYSNLLEAVSKIGDRQNDIDEIKYMTDAFEKVVGKKNIYLGGQKNE